MHNERGHYMKIFCSSAKDDDVRGTTPNDDHEDHGISTYDDDEARRIKISKTGLKI